MSEAASPARNEQAVYVVPFADLRMKDVPAVGGKNASLGEMISQLQEKGVRVPGGFATTSQAYRDFLAYSADGSETLAKRIEKRLEGVHWRRPAPKSASGSSHHHFSRAWTRKVVRKMGHWPAA